MILLSTLVKALSVTVILLTVGGSTYYYLGRDNVETTTTQNLKRHRLSHNFQFSHDETTDQSEYIFNDNSTNTIVEPERPARIPIKTTLAHEKMLLRNHKSGNWETIRIKPDFSYLSAPPEYADFLENKLIKAATSFLATTVKVYPTAEINEVGKCAGITISLDEGNKVTDADLVIYFVASYSSSLWKTRSTTCTLDSTTLRPTVGVIEFNARYLKQLNLSKLSDGKWQRQWIPTTIHEMIHVLGFSTGAFKFYVDPNTNEKLGIEKVVLKQDGRDWVILPKVVDAVRNHFGCSTAIGAPLENTSGSGTHWERTIFGNEAMTASELPDAVFSTITFSLLESTGWYSMDYQKSQPFNWGKDEGCDIAQGQCPKGLREFCTPTENDGCTTDFTGIALCSQNDVYADGCAYWKAYANSDCRYYSAPTEKLTSFGGHYGNDGKCFLTTLPSLVGFEDVYSDCFQASCVNNVITFSVADKSYTCTENGQIVNVMYSDKEATVTCPDVKQFCDTQKICPNACNGVGTCRDTSCDCWAGYSGDDCSVQE